MTTNDSDHEDQAFLDKSEHNGDASDTVAHKPDNRRKLRTYLRWLWDLAAASAIIYLLISRYARPSEALRRSPIPQLDRKIYTFQNDPQYVRGDMFYNRSATVQTLHNWLGLSSGSRGYVVIENSSRYDLPPPYTVAIDRDNDGPGYMMTVFHQLHCLSYIVDHYQQGYGGTELSDEVAHHSAHCFNYLRQGIMCSADTTLEGKTEAGPGEGSEHECTDYDALLDWVDRHSAWKWRGNLPEEAIL